jgi:hypothetical protein
MKNVIPCGMKVQWQQVGRRTLLGNNGDGGAVTLLPIMSRSVEFCISTGPPFYVHIVEHMLTQIRLAPELPKLPVA